jgi:hypothetical protein
MCHINRQTEKSFTCRPCTWYFSRMDNFCTPQNHSQMTVMASHLAQNMLYTMTCMDAVSSGTWCCPCTWQLFPPPPAMQFGSKIWIIKNGLSASRRWCMPILQLVADATNRRLALRHSIFHHLSHVMITGRNRGSSFIIAHHFSVVAWRKLNTCKYTHSFHVASNVVTFTYQM